jgi:hypothetical protein
VAAQTQLSGYALEERLVSTIRALGGDVTAGDVAARSGLPLSEVEDGMRRLLSLYKSHLDVDDDGNLRYRFDPDMTRRGARDAGHLLHRLRAWAWSAFVFLFKAGIMVTLIGYTLLFVVILLTLAVAALGAMFSSDSDSDGLGDLLFLPLRLLAELLEFVFWINFFSEPSGRRGRGRGRIKRFHERVEKPFYQKIFDFVFGPQPERDPLAIHRAFASFIRANQGRVSAADWASRSGQSLEDAERALTAALVRFGGDVEVDDDGQLVYTFDELRLTSKQDGSNTALDDPGAIWNRTAKAPPLTGNPSSTNWWIGAFNAFNLVMSAVISFTAANALGTAAAVGLGFFPLVFSLIFFAVPAARRVRHSRLEREARAENARRDALRRIWESTDGGIARALPASHIHALVRDQLARDFDAEVEVDPNSGELTYRFETLAAQRRAADAARRDASRQVVFGRSVFSSDEDEVPQHQADLDEFDRLLAAELGDDEVAFDFQAAPAYARS